VHTIRIHAEVGNAAKKRIIIFKESIDPARASFSKCLEFIKYCRIITSRDLADLALDIALENKSHSMIPSSWQQRRGKGVSLLSLDKKRYEKARENKMCRYLIEWSNLDDGN